MPELLPAPVLVGIDHVESARRAFAAAVELTRLSGSPLHLAHVRLRQPSLRGQTMSPASRARADREAAELLAEHAATARERDVEVASTHVRYAERVELGLVEVQRELGAGLLVVGAGRNSTVGRRLCAGGRLPASELGRADASVLVVR